MKKVNNEKRNQCDGMRDDGTCGNGSNPFNHNKPCMGSNCPHKFKFDDYPSSVTVSKKRDGNVAKSYRDRVSDQYRTVCEKTGEFFREVVKFGALLNEVESAIGNTQDREGSGLKGWLADNCPDVNYNTAAGYKAMAAKCAKMIGGGTQALACLQDQSEVRLSGGNVIEVDAEVIEKRDALFDKVESRRQLEQMWFQFCGASKGKAGRPVGSVSQYKKPDTNDPATCARAEWSRVIVPATNTTVLGASAKLLKLQDVEDALVALKVLIDFLKEREKELKR